MAATTPTSASLSQPAEAVEAGGGCWQLGEVDCVVIEPEYTGLNAPSASLVEISRCSAFFATQEPAIMKTFVALVVLCALVVALSE